MCITSVARVLSIEGEKATVRFLNTGAVREVDVSMVDVKAGSYVDVFAESAIRRVTKREADLKRRLRSELGRIMVDTR